MSRVQNDDRDNRILFMRDTEGATFAAIGEEIGVTASRACKLYKQAVERNEALAAAFRVSPDFLALYLVSTNWWRAERVYEVLQRYNLTLRQAFELDDKIQGGLVGLTQRNINAIKRAAEAEGWTR